jgi:cytochrome b561
MALHSIGFGRQKKMVSHYRPIVIWLHWLMAVMLVIVCLSMEFISLYPKGSSGRTLMLSTHYLLGLVILILAVIRLWLWWRSEPIEKPDHGHMQTYVARAVFILLYGLMITLPIIGWVDIGLWDVTVSALGWQLPQIASPDSVIAEELSQIHILMAKTGYGLVGLHGTAALYHHFILKDATLKRMLPRFRQRA